MSVDSPSKRSGRPATTERNSTPQAALDAVLSGDAGDPIRRALWLDEVDRRLGPLLPTPLADHARLANIDGNTLVFLVDSPIWHTRLRLAADGLLDAARSVGLDVDKVAIRTSSLPRQRTTSATPSDPSRPRPAIPAAFKAALASLGSSDRDGTGNNPGQDDA